jgi:hypothetical protein
MRVNCPKRVAGEGGADLMLRFQLKRGDNETKHHQNMKRIQRTHLDSMKSKRDIVRWCDNVAQRRGDTSEGKGRRRR